MKVKLDINLSNIIERRRDLHRYPEAGWTEYRTASIVATELTRLGYQVVVGQEACRSASRLGVPDIEQLRQHEARAVQEGADPKWVDKMKDGHTAVVGILKGEKPGPIMALRFDMDSNELDESDEEDHLPQKEQFRSCHPGLMHACAHDGHTSIGLGLAEVLAANKHNIQGEIRLLFQPAEEGCRGAQSMVDAGWLNNVDYFLGGHIGTKSLELGEVVATTKGFLATSKIDATFNGRPAHAGGSPEAGRNALLAGAAAALQLHGISRHSGGATRINVGTLNAGTGRNVIPARSHLALEIRGETTELNDYMKEEAYRILDGVAHVYGVTCETKLMGEGMSATSSPELACWIEAEAKKIEAVHTVRADVNFAASEDATIMMNKVIADGGKATYLLFGSPLKEGHHQSKFDFDERVLGIAIEVLFRLVMSAPVHGKGESA